MNTTVFNLPGDAEDFFRAGNQFEYDTKSVEAGDVKLKSFDKLKLEEVWIEAGNTEGDPHGKENGYYSIPAVSLTGECKNYNPNFILLWLPSEKLFGAWDCDHWVLTVFRGANWVDIVANPAIYLNAQWDAYRKIGEQFIPWPKYPFKSGRPF